LISIRGWHAQRLSLSQPADNRKRNRQHHSVRTMAYSLSATTRLPWASLLPAIFFGACAVLLAPWLDWHECLILLALSLLAAAAAWAMSMPQRWWFAFFAATLLLPPLPLDFGNTGPHVAVVFAAVALLGGLLRFSQWRLPKTSIAAALALLLSVLLLSVLTAFLYSGLSIAAATLARVLLFGIAVYAFFDLSCGPARETDPVAFARRLYFLGMGAALIALLDFYFQWPPVAGFGEQFVWLPGRIVRRAQGFFYEAGMLGNLCAFLLVMIVLAALRPEVGRRLFSRNLLRAGGLVFSAALLFSYSRASLLNLVAALTAAAFLHRESLPDWRRTKAVVIGILAGLALVVLTSPAFAQSYVRRILGSAIWVFHDPRALLAGRFEAWESLIGFLAAHPWHLLFGIGFKTLPYTTVAGRPLIADNMYLSMLVETGVIGLLAMLLLNAVILVSAYRASRGGTVAGFFGALIFCFWIGQLFQMLLIDTLTYWRVLPLYFAVLALAVREVDPAPETGQHP
jgi:hypothetical protein